jgi:hypothetical protein
LKFPATLIGYIPGNFSNLMDQWMVQGHL